MALWAYTTVLGGGDKQISGRWVVNALWSISLQGMKIPDSVNDLVSKNERSDWGNLTSISNLHLCPREKCSPLTHMCTWISHTCTWIQHTYVHMNIAHTDTHTHRVRGTKLKHLKVKENRRVLENFITLVCTYTIQCNEVSTIITKPLLDSQIVCLVVTYGVKPWVAIFDAEKTAYCNKVLKLGGSWGNSGGLSLHRTWDVITEEIKLGFNAICNRRIVSELRVLQWKTN